MNSWKRNVTTFMITQTISLLGSMLVNYAIMWYITLTTQSGLMMMFQVLAYAIPSLFLAPFAGVWADKLNRKMVIILADGMIAVITLVTALLFISGIKPLWMIFVVSAIRSMGQAIHQPSVNSTYQEIVPQDRLMRVNSINQTIQASMMILLPIAAAFLLSVSSIEWLFMIDVGTAAVAILAILTLVNIPRRGHEKDGQKIHYLNDINDGLKYIRGHDYLVPFFVFMTLLWFLIAPVSFLTPLQVARNFGDEVWRLSAIEIGFALGMTLGGILMATWGGFKNRAWTLVFANVVLGLLTVGFGVVHSFEIYVGLMGLTGFFIPFFNTPSVTLLQERVEKEYTGRIFSVMGVLQGVTTPLSMLLFGPLADFVSIDIIVIFTGILTTTLSAFIVLNKPIMKAGNTLAIHHD